jgi:hypothetical protein
LGISVACSQSPVIHSKPTVELVSVSIPASLTPISAPLQQCASESPEFSLLLEQLPGNPKRLKENYLNLWWGEPPNTEVFTYYLATEQMAVIVHPSNSIGRLSSDEIRDLFTGQILSWEEIGGRDQEVVVWTFPPGNELSQILQIELLNNQGISPFAKLAPSPQAMLEAVSTDPGAIGTLPHAWVTNEIQPVELIDTQQVNFSRPILAFSNEQPEGGSRDLLGCLQSPVGRNRLAEIYSP